MNELDAIQEALRWAGRLFYDCEPVKPCTRKYKPATDQLFLDRIAAGTLRVNTRLAIVWVRRPGKKWRRLVVQPDRRERYQVVRLYRDGARKGIMLHRLVWLAAHERLIPEGYEIHHKSGRDRNGIKHLELMGHGDHLALTLGYPESWDEVQEDF